MTTGKSRSSIYWTGVLAGGVVITGDITLSIADVDLVIVSLRTLISSVGSLLPPDPAPGDQ